jgi:hypothetical protein
MHPKNIVDIIDLRILFTLESTFKAPATKKPGDLPSQRLANSTPPSGMPLMSGRLVNKLPPEDEVAPHIEMRLSNGFHEDMGAGDKHE